MEKIYTLTGVATVTGLLSAATACIGCIGSALTSDAAFLPAADTPEAKVFIALLLIAGLLAAVFILLKNWITRLEQQREDLVNPSGNEIHEYRNEYYDYINSKIIH